MQKKIVNGVLLCETYPNKSVRLTQVYTDINGLRHFYEIIDFHSNFYEIYNGQKLKQYEIDDLINIGDGFYITRSINYSCYWKINRGNSNISHKKFNCR